MYAKPRSEMCPVLSYKKYITKLHPKLNSLWQQPLNTFLPKQEVWYARSPIGANTLQKIRPRISQQACLSKCYTNHCIRATSVTIMDESVIDARHIMRISGHR